ncbi:MAG: ATP-dependent RecD-like DNA helicase [Bacteroidales bacterium]|nr:ATP-dependent RecD-like DNA helicase [Bacteroidales bacterium]MCM1415850.1 ATP-dependent RecD-like DNA helicase [bacterium]MCM1423160.1 ATP-dependent RecD-like DNA helicase [bacterium]
MDTIKGYIEHIIFRNKENGYTVLNLLTQEESLTCVGFFRTMDQGETIEAEGEYTTHQVYGRQFKIERYNIIPPSDAQSVERYLSSGAVKGVGEALARRIVKAFGEDTYRIIEEEPERLAEVKGISLKKAREIAASLYEKRDARDALTFLQGYGIGNTLALRIYETYGMGLYGVMRENPYRLAEDVSGIGFRIADEIAAKIGIHTDSDYRIRCGLLYTLQQAGGEGHCYLPAEKLLARAEELLGVEAALMEPQLANLAMDKKLVIKSASASERRVYASNFYYAELACAKMLHDLNVKEELLPAEEEALFAKIALLEQDLSIELDDLQRHSVLESIRNGVFILSGGPGTGKTTTINAIIRYFLSQGMDILLAAPTGRAAKRMTEATGYEARTVHRLLELSGAAALEGKSARFERNEENPLEADVIIVDEMSMVDIFLFQSLLKAVPVGTRLILVGDVNQLPSVGPGQVLHDLIESGAFETVVLKKIFRQAQESDIVLNAHRIYAGEELVLDNKSRDFFFLERNDTDVIYKHMLQLILEKLPRYVDATPFDIQVLTPMRKGKLGVETLNGILQRYLNPPDPSKRECQAGDMLLREGDKVMQIKNNYQLAWEVVSRYNIPIDSGMGIFNGDIGFIRTIDEYAREVVVEFDEHRRVTYPYAGLDELELAYAVTIHKSQGSEYPAVVMPLLSGPHMLFNRNLLYTGVTRAKSCVTILGSRVTISAMIANNRENRRYTGFLDQLRSI